MLKLNLIVLVSNDTCGTIIRLTFMIEARLMSTYKFKIIFTWSKLRSGCIHWQIMTFVVHLLDWHSWLMEGWFSVNTQRSNVQDILRVTQNISDRCDWWVIKTLISSQVFPMWRLLCGLIWLNSGVLSHFMF